ncbi:MAG: glycosyltransferase family 1 protein [Clostridia bacterium]|nr:glycosyltransferase family 1 protein [Clostridia bacterium]
MSEQQQPIRVLNFFTILNRGGAETMVMNYYRHIDRTKVQFDFVVHREEKGAYEDEILAMGGRIYRMPPIRPWNTAKYKKLLRAFFAEHPEYRILHFHISELGMQGVIEAERAGIPYRCVHAHTRMRVWDVKTFPRFVMKKRMASHITHRFICGQEAGVWLFGKKHEKEFIMLNNAVDAGAFRFDPDRRAAVRASLGLHDELTVGHVGTFIYPKNHPFLIDSFAALHRKHPDSALLLVGQGDDLEAMKKKAADLGLTDSVRFLGSRADVKDLLQAMDVFAFPSHYEGLSVASIEAQAAGLPVLISDKVPIECKKTDNVFVQPLESGPDAWADELIRLAALPRTDTYEQIRDSGFDIVENAAWLQNFYLSLAKGE